MPTNFLLNFDIFRYLSEFTDGFAMQSVSSTIFLFIAILATNIAFGGLLGDVTKQQIGVIECLLGTCIAGVAYALFSGQPLSIIGPTGPVLVFETLVYYVA